MSQTDRADAVDEFLFVTHQGSCELFASALDFIGTKGESVGREWDYRKYIGGVGPEGGGGKVPHRPVSIGSSCL